MITAPRSLQCTLSPARWPLAIIATGASCGAGWTVTQLPEPQFGQQAVLMVLLALNLLSFAVAVRRASPVGFFAGAYLLGVQAIGWTIPSSGWIIAAVSIAVSAALFLASDLRHWRLRELGYARFPLLLGPLLVVPSVLSAALSSNGTLAAQRLLLLAVPIAILLAFSRARGVPIAWGIVAGVNLIVGSLLASGITAPLGLERFGGGEALLVHPNLLGLAAWTSALAWLVLPGCDRIARVPGLAVSVALVVLTDSRSSLGALLLGVFVVGMAIHRGGRGRRPLADNFVLAVAGVAIAAVGTTMVAREFVLLERSAESGILSGRSEQWKDAYDQFAQSSPAEQLLGTAGGGVGGGLSNEHAGATNVSRYSVTQRFYSVDSAIPALLLRSGLVGIALGAFGFFYILRAIRRHGGRADSVAPAAILAGAVTTLPVEAWLFSSGSLWIWIAAAGRLIEAGSPEVQA